jgi:hypothetical protein
MVGQILCETPTSFESWQAALAWRDRLLDSEGAIKRESVDPDVASSLIQALQGILDAERNGKFHPRGIKQSRADALYQAKKTLERIGKNLAGAEP